MERLWAQLAPRKQVGELASVAVDAVRSQRELVLENAVLRHQVNVLRRRSKRPTLHLVDRLKLLLGARWLPSWRRVIVLVQPDTVLRWHRAGFRRFWRRRSRPRQSSPLPPATMGLIRDMAARGRLWGAERIRGELLRVAIRVSKRTIQKYMRSVRGKSGGGQRWATFVKNHAPDAVLAVLALDRGARAGRRPGAARRAVQAVVVLVGARDRRPGRARRLDSAYVLDS
jgi:hypothetical protein